MKVFFSVYYSSTPWKCVCDVPEEFMYLVRKAHLATAYSDNSEKDFASRIVLKFVNSGKWKRFENEEGPYEFVCFISSP